MIKYSTKFIKDIPTVIEIECAEIFCLPGELLPGETKYQILAPAQHKGEVWYCHAIYNTIYDARNALIGDVKRTMQRDADKSKTEFSESDFFKKIASIKIVNLEKANA